MTQDRVPVCIAVLTVSDTRDETTDKSGKLLVERLEAAGHILHEKQILPDDIYPAPRPSLAVDRRASRPSHHHHRRHRPHRPRRHARGRQRTL